MPRKTPETGSPAVHLRRMYVDCRYGQLHLRSAFASNGGFDELTPLVCLHQSPMSSRVFEGFLRLMGNDRSAYAPDTPGFGASDAPASQPGVADYAAAIGDALDHLRLRKVDLLGYHDGSSIAAELATTRPEQVRRVVMIGTPRDLPRLTQPVLVLRPKDELSDVTPRALAALPEAKIVNLTEHGRDLFDVAPEVVARHVRAFLDD
jgi:pimeloyl-ACP methyl ester carboxylesterase